MHLTTQYPQAGDAVVFAAVVVAVVHDDAATASQAVDRLRKDDTSGLAAVLSRELQRQQAGAGAAESAGLPQQHQQKVLEPLLLHPIPLLLPAASFSLSPVFVPPSTVSIKPVAYASPGSSGSSSRRQQQHDLLRPEKGTWGLGRIEARDVSCSTNEGLSAPENVSVFEAYRLHSTAATNEHGSVITVRLSPPAPLFLLLLFSLCCCYPSAYTFCCFWWWLWCGCRCCCRCGWCCSIVKTLLYCEQNREVLTARIAARATAALATNACAVASDAPAVVGGMRERVFCGCGLEPSRADLSAGSVVASVISCIWHRRSLRRSSRSRRR